MTPEQIVEAINDRFTLDRDLKKAVLAAISGAIKQEREACAELMLALGSSCTKQQLADAIRRRGQP